MPYTTPWKIVEDTCVLISKSFLHKSTQCNPGSYEEQAYTEWRDVELQKRFSDFNLSDITGKSVIDFGCGYGSLAIHAARLGAASVIGFDLDDHRIGAATENAAHAIPNKNVSFKRAAPGRIPASGNSADTILCFDVLEHIMDFRSIFREWQRVLKTGGKVLIDWTPWTHPHAHHLWTIMPLPWVHLVMPEPSVLRVCARIYDLPEFKPRFFHYDENHNRKKNPYASTDNYGDLNKLTVSKFETEIMAAGLTIQRKQVIPFSGRPMLAKQILAQAPLIYPYFCSRIIYEIAKGPDTSNPAEVGVTHASLEAN